MSTDDPHIRLSRLARNLLNDLADYYTPVHRTDAPVNEAQATQLVLDAFAEAVAIATRSESS